MKKVTDFIVNKKNFILVIFIIISALALFLSNKVKINYDMTQYLPKTSETKIGVNIMNKYFDDIKESNLNVMFKGLSSNEKEKIKKELKNIDNVSEVLYNNSKDYNKKDYTLYVIKVDNYDDSKIAKKIFNKIKKEYKDYDVYFSGSINEANGDVLPLWIVVLAVFCAFLILIVMCDSYVEPILILITILLAVLINKGSNIIFPNISNITNSICAILQMALSIDYSIMLINRYSQEREKNDNKEEAMKKALYYSFKSISSSSITTIVGLLALVFMSFTIGKDLGFVLAKGVLLSLLSIFLCLPALLILSDNLIKKTQKKTVHFKMDFLGKFSYKLRYILTSLFIIIFIIAYFLKGTLGITYTDSENDDVQKYFKENNQIAIIYNNKYENKIAKYCKNLSNNKITNVLCYGNTIGEKLNYKDLNTRLNDLDNNTNIEDYLLKIVYYNYYNKNNNLKLSYNEFINFIESEIYKNNSLNKEIDNEMKNNIQKLKNFTNVDLINKKRTSIEIANILSIDSKMIDNIYVLNHADEVNIKIDINSFLNFINRNVLTDNTYKSSFTKEQLNYLNQLSFFTNKNYIQNKQDATSIANHFNLDKQSVDNLLLLYNLNKNNDNKFSISDLIINTYNLKNNTTYLNDVDVSKLTNLFNIALNENNINGNKLNKVDLIDYFKNINPNLVNLVYSQAKLDDNTTMTPSEFIEFTLNNFNSFFDDNIKNDLSLLKLVIDDTLNTDKILYSSDDISSLLNVDKNMINNLYNLINYTKNSDNKISPLNFVKFLLENKNDPKINLDKDKIKTLSMVNEIMESVINNKKYSIQEMTSLLNIDQNKLKILYSLYDIKINSYNKNMSLNNFINYMLNNIVNNSQYNNIDKSEIAKLNTLSNIMNDTVNNQKFTYKDIYSNLSTLSNDLNKNLFELVYIYYGSINNYNNNYKLTIEEFINYLNKDIIYSNLFKEYIDTETKNNIKTAKNTIKDSKKLLISNKYSRIILNTTFKLEDKESLEFVKKLRTDLKNIGNDIYVIGDTPMAFDMSKSFDREMNLITILTMIFIFIVVAVTFKSFLIPLILVLVIQCAVFLTMGILSVSKEPVYFIALLIVQSILMGATIDYAIVYTSYYLESRKKNNKFNSVINAYNKSIHTISTSSSILIIVTLIVGYFSANITSKICITLSKGTICSAVLILLLLPAILLSFDKLITKKKLK